MRVYYSWVQNSMHSRDSNFEIRQAVLKETETRVLPSLSRLPWRPRLVAHRFGRTMKSQLSLNALTRTQQREVQQMTYSGGELWTSTSAMCVDTSTIPKKETLPSRSRLERRSKTCRRTGPAPSVVQERTSSLSCRRGALATRMR